MALDRAGYVDTAVDALKDVLPQGTAAQLASLLARPPATPPPALSSASGAISSEAATQLSDAAVKAEGVQAKGRGSGELLALGGCMAVGVLAYTYRRALAKALAQVRMPACAWVCSQGRRGVVLRHWRVVCALCGRDRDGANCLGVTPIPFLL